MNAFWEVMILLIFIFIVFLIPMAIFHYEAYDEVEIRSKKVSNQGAWVSAIKMELLVLIVTGLTLGLLYAFIGIAKVPVVEYNLDATSATLWMETPPTMVDISTASGVIRYDMIYIYIYIACI
jgi:hypothetical protein